MSKAKPADPAAPTTDLAPEVAPVDVAAVDVPAEPDADRDNLVPLLDRWRDDRLTGAEMTELKALLFGKFLAPKPAMAPHFSASAPKKAE